MFGTDLYIALILGVLLSLLFSEKTGVVPAGLIVPGYLALVFDQVLFMTLVVLVSILTYVTVKYGLSKIMILYGRRKFAAMLITGIIFKLAVDFAYPITPFEAFEFRGLGVIVPGLIANTIHRQGVVITIGSTLLLSGLTFGIMYVYFLF
ncbi:poly-gamma-glutamate biosynthesis protein PgsC [Shouchella patagoniensis]|uniref:poly-gamma-glutamate biosynthesis protein PgsC n=1 Tax=Bacillaceae TaxID=186817 RepID=UPI0006CF4DFB|nr:poly-gamma-glutamate biosynthesis protein PgsC [Shouchella patagoniensis]